MRTNRAKEKNETQLVITLVKYPGSEYSAKQVSGKNTTGNTLHFQQASYSGTKADRSFPGGLVAFRTVSQNSGGNKK